MNAKTALVGLSRLSAGRSVHYSHSYSSVALFSSDVQAGGSAERHAPSTKSNARDYVYQQRFEDLNYSLEHRGNPNRVYTNYISLMNIIGYEKLPVELHQQVLRKCTPSTEELRSAGIKRIFAGNLPIDPHTHEGRFQAVVRNIRAVGSLPSVDDYNFILGQFAAVAHHEGVMHVYREMLQFGVRPSTKTYGLCLQAIATRLAVPTRKDGISALVLQTRKMLTTLMDDMRTESVKMTSVNLDLIIRILKYSSDFNGFNMLMKVGYGVDLSNPDRQPFEAEPSDSAGFTRQPFSTAALNTTVDMLGRLGMVSKMIQAFEVLTQPLPPNANAHFSATFEEEDDFGVSIAPPPPHYISPHAHPNTTTFNMLISWLAKSGHHTLCRHYTIQLMKVDQAENKWLMERLIDSPPNRILSPRTAVNTGALRGLFAIANKDKNAKLMRWLWQKCFTLIRRKNYSLETFTAYAAKLAEPRLESESQSNSQSSYNPNGGFRHHLIKWDKKWRPPPNAPELDNPEPLSTPPQNFQSTTTHALRAKVLAELDVNFDTPAVPPPAPIKYLNVDRHITILKRDIIEIEAFQKQCATTMERTRQRIKENLGRRVWNGKDIYLRSEGGRQKLARGTWTRIVKFAKDTKPLPGLSPERLEAVREKQRLFKRSERQPPQLAEYYARELPPGTRGFATSNYSRTDWALSEAPYSSSQTWSDQHLKY